MSLTPEEALARLREGNQRFLNANNHHRTYRQDELSELAVQQRPIAAVITCSDSRVAPEVVFDQPLGALFVSRVPANVASDGAKWLVDIAVEEFKVPLIVVMAHTGCVAVGQVVSGTPGGSGGPLRLRVVNALYRAKNENPADLYRATIEYNAKLAIEQFQDECPSLRTAVAKGETKCVPMIYDMQTGEARRLE